MAAVLLRQRERHCGISGSAGTRLKQSGARFASGYRLFISSWGHTEVIRLAVIDKLLPYECDTGNGSTGPLEGYLGLGFFPVLEENATPFCKSHFGLPAWLRDMAIGDHPS